ncbi:MAG: histidinol dehydrogenase [Planctomycetota bacterium]
MSEPLLRRVEPADVPELRRMPVDPETLAEAASIIAEVREGGTGSLRACAERFGDRAKGEPLVIERDELDAARDAIDQVSLGVLERAAERIRIFATAQRESLGDCTIGIPGGEAGHWVAPVERAGCYAPGGRFPLPSSVLMTAVTARAAGVDEVIVASPRPAPVTLAAASVAGADRLLACGGAHAIAAFAYGAGNAISPMDAVVGPGNRWVTAAKQLVAGVVRIDMLAGPSELVVLADASANPATIAADLLAQAEHDIDAQAVLVSTDASLIERVESCLEEQIAKLPTAETARVALQNGFAVLVNSIEDGIAICDRLAPEHLELDVKQAAEVAPRLAHYGGLFIGDASAEVLGDYGAGPNHTLPTGGTARSNAGLSVFDFLRVRTWMRIDEPERAQGLVSDAIGLARLEGLEGHARSAERRLI